MKTWMCIICFSILFSGNNLAQANKSFSITHIVYPEIEDYTDLFVDIYTELGFTVSIIPTPSVRGLILLNNGVVDADVVRLSYVAKKYPNVIIVKPELNRTDLTLLCVKSVPCTKDIIADENISIMAVDNTLSLLEPGEFKAHQVNNDAVSNVPEMLKAKRYLYALFVLDDKMKKHFAREFQLVKLKSMSVNHIIHKKHIALLPQIEDKIRTKLPEFRRTRAIKTNL